MYFHRLFIIHYYLSFIIVVPTGEHLLCERELVPKYIKIFVKYFQHSTVTKVFSF